MSDVSIVDAANATNVSTKTLMDAKNQVSHLKTLKSELKSGEIKYEFTDNLSQNDAITSYTQERRTANKYMWSSSTLEYSFESQKWSVNSEVYGTYSKNANGFVSSGYLVNPTSQNDYNLALREGYLGDFAYINDEGHFYQTLISSDIYNDVTFMLEPNADVFILDSNAKVIYNSIKEEGIQSYFTRYYPTKKTIKGVSNRVISMGLIQGTYYFFFLKRDESVTVNNHYGFYTGQPLPIARSMTASSRMHKTTIQWDKISRSQSANAPSISITCSDGMADEYALTGATFVDESQVFANNTYASSIDYYYTPATAGYSVKLTSKGGWWSDLVDYNPPAGSIEGTYASKVTVHWVNNLSYVNAKCTTQTRMTLNYLVPFGILAG